MSTIERGTGMAEAARDGTAKGRVDHEALLRKLHPARLVERDGQVVGAWAVVATRMRSQSAEAPRGPLSFDADVQGFVRTADGVAGLRARVPLDGRLRESVEAALHGLGATDDVALRARSDADFSSAMRHAATLAGLAGPEAGTAAMASLSDAVARTLDDVLGDTLDDAALDRLAQARATTMVGRMREAVASFDPDAVDLLLELECHGPALATGWSGIDRNLDDEAPLALALDTAPDRAGEFIAAWHADPDAFTAPLRDGDWEGMLASMAVARAEIPASRAGMLGEAVRAMGRIKPDTRAAAFGGGDDARADACALLTLLDGHGAGADPVDMRGWSSLVRLAPALGAARAWAGDGAGELLALDRGAPAALERLRTASGKASLPEAIARVGDMAGAFAREVLRPAAALAGHIDGMPPAGDRRWTTAAADILWSGRPLATMVADAQSWSGPAPGETADAHVPVPDPAWKAVLPGFAAEGGTISVAGSLADLDGLSAPSPGGLGVDLTGYARECAAGTRRVAAITRTMPDGSREVLSCHLLAIHGDRVEPVGVLGRDGGRVAPTCVDAISRYAASVSRDPAVDLPGILVSGVATDALRRERGIVAEGTWAEAKAAWGRHVGAGSSARLLAGMMATHMAEGRPAWSADRIDADGRKVARTAFQAVLRPEVVEVPAPAMPGFRGSSATVEKPVPAPRMRIARQAPATRDADRRPAAAPGPVATRAKPVPAATPTRPAPRKDEGGPPPGYLSQNQRKALRNARRNEMLASVAAEARERCALHGEPVGPSVPVRARAHVRPVSKFSILDPSHNAPGRIAERGSEPDVHVAAVPAM